MGVGPWAYFQTAGLFMLGMLIGRQGWLLKSSLPGWGRVLAWALVAFFPLYGLNNMLPSFIENANILSR